MSTRFFQLARRISSSTKPSPVIISNPTLTTNTNCGNCGGGTDVIIRIGVPLVLTGVVVSGVVNMLSVTNDIRNQTNYGYIYQEK